MRLIRSRSILCTASFLTCRAASARVAFAAARALLPAFVLLVADGMFPLFQTLAQFLHTGVQLDRV